MMNKLFKMITVGSVFAFACGTIVFACPKRNAGPNDFHSRTPEVHKGWSGPAPHHDVKPNEFRHNPGFNHNPNFNHNHDFKHNSAPKPEGFSSRDFKSKDFNRKPEFNHKPDFNHDHSPDFKPNAFGHKPGFRHNPNFAPAPASTEATTTTENATEQTVK